MEFQILDWLQRLRSPALDRLMVGITRFGDLGLIWIMLAALLFFFPKHRRSGAILFAALLFDLVLCNGILKPLFARPRPFDVDPSVLLLIPGPKDFSFPSGHTAAGFCSALALFLSGERCLWKAALLLAVLMALSRLYLYVHYPTDVLGGIAAGALAGALGYAAVRTAERRGRCR